MDWFPIRRRDWSWKPDWCRARCSSGSARKKCRAELLCSFGLPAPLWNHPLVVRRSRRIPRPFAIFDNTDTRKISRREARWQRSYLCRPKVFYSYGLLYKKPPRSAKTTWAHTLYSPSTVEGQAGFYEILSGEIHPEVIGPQKKREDALPKGEMQEPYGEKPSGAPQKPRRPVLYDFNFFHRENYTIC